MANSFTYKYVPDPNRREANLFREEYYSSTDVRIYFDDEEQTEIASISYTINEQLSPIYGYKSRTWDDVAVGTRIVNGVIEMPIKNPERQFYESDKLKDALYSNTDISAGFNEISRKDSYNKNQDDILDNTEWADTETTNNNTPKSTLDWMHRVPESYHQDWMHKAPDNTYTSTNNVTIINELTGKEPVHIYNPSGEDSNWTADSSNNAPVNDNGSSKKSSTVVDRYTDVDYGVMLVKLGFIPKKNITEDDITKGIKDFQSVTDGLAVNGKLNYKTKKEILSFYNETIESGLFTNS